MSPGTRHTFSSSIGASSKCATSKPGGCARSSPESTCDVSGMGVGRQRHRSRQVPTGRGRKHHRKKRACMASCAQTTWRGVVRDRWAPDAASWSMSLSSSQPFRSSSSKIPRCPHSIRHPCSQPSMVHLQKAAVAAATIPSGLINPCFTVSRLPLQIKHERTEPDITSARPHYTPELVTSTPAPLPVRFPRLHFYLVPMIHHYDFTPRSNPSDFIPMRRADVQL
jgi:hypothetical protein